MAGPILNNTPDRIVRLAMEDACLLGQGADPQGEDYASFFPRLLEMINLWQTDGLRLWLNQDVAVPLVAGTALYSLGGPIFKPTRVIQAYYQDSSQNRRDITVMGREEYTRLSNVSQLGAINSYFVDKQQTTLNVFFWLTPDTEAATGSVHLIRQEQVSNVISLSDTMNFPVEWFIALHWGLAAEIASGQPQAVINRCEAKAAFYKEKLDNWDVEDAPTRFEADISRAYPTGAFR